MSKKENLYLSNRLKECGVMTTVKEIAFEYRRSGDDSEVRCLLNKMHPVRITRFVFMINSEKYKGFCYVNINRLDTDINFERLVLWLDIKKGCYKIYIDNTEIHDPMCLFSYGEGVENRFEKLIFVDRTYLRKIEEPNGISSLLRLTAKYIQREKEIKEGGSQNVN